MPFIGEVRQFAGNYAPQGWAFCDGQLLPIAGNTTLYGILGTRFGGNGTTTFALPDFRGRTPIGSGQGPGLSLRNVGQSGGAETQPLTIAQTPGHTHAVRAAAATGTSDSPAGNVLARTAAAIPHYGSTADANLAPNAIAPAGGGQPHNNMQPYLVVSYIIALQGTVPQS